MSPRVTSDLLLVGSIPAESTEDALRTAAANFALPRPGVRPAGRRDGAAVVVGGLRAGTPRAPEPGHRDGEGDRLADRATAAYVRGTGLQGQAGSGGRVLGHLAARGRRDRLLPGLQEAARGGRHPCRRAIPGRAAVPGQRAERAARRLRRRLPGRRAGLRGPRGQGDRPAAPPPSRRKTWRSSGTSLTRPSTSRACCHGAPTARGTATRTPSTGSAADPRGGPDRLPPVLRHVPRVADVRGAGHERPGQDGELRGRELRPHHRLGAHGRPALPAQRGSRASSARSPDCGQGRQDLPRHRAAAGRRAGAATAAGHRGEVPAGLRRRDVLRLPRPARQHPRAGDPRAPRRGDGGPPP